MSTAFGLGELAERVGGTVRGDPKRVIRGISTLDQAGPHELSFLTNRKYRDQAERTEAGALLVAPGSGLTDRDLLEVDEPYLALAELLELFHPAPPRRPGISPSAIVAENVRLGEQVAVGPLAVIDEGAELGDGATIGVGCVVGRDCRVGRGSELKPKVVLYPGTHIGERCLIHSGVVLGGDGFGFATSGGRHRKVPQLGRLVVEDDVEIGPNTTADRGALGETRIGAGTKIDNLVMIAHGVQLGAASLLIAQSGIAGSTKVGAGTTIAGQSGAAGHLNIGEGSVIAAKSALFNDLEPGSIVAGVPAVDHRLWKRTQAVLRRLPEMWSELRDLRTRLAALEDKQED